MWSSLLHLIFLLSPINTHHSFNNPITSNPISLACDSRATSRAHTHVPSATSPFLIQFSFASSHSSKPQTVYTVLNFVPVCADVTTTVHDAVSLSLSPEKEGSCLWLGQHWRLPHPAGEFLCFIRNKMFSRTIRFLPVNSCYYVTGRQKMSILWGSTNYIFCNKDVRSPRFFTFNEINNQLMRCENI